METKNFIDSGTAFALSEAEMRAIAAVENQHYFNPAQRADIQSEQNFDNFVMQKSEVRNNTRDLQIAQIRNKAPYLPITLPPDSVICVPLPVSIDPLFVNFPVDTKIINIKVAAQRNSNNFLLGSFTSQGRGFGNYGTNFFNSTAIYEGDFIINVDSDRFFYVGSESGIWLKHFSFPGTDANMFATIECFNMIY